MVEPLPGSHLCRVDCAGCGLYIYSVPAHADVALCTQCGREKHGASENLAAPPEPFGRVILSPKTAAAPRPVSGAAAGSYPVACPREPPCGWRSTAVGAREAVVMERVHHHVRHDPAGWASGVAGGLRGYRRP